MSLIERDVVLTSKQDGQNTIDMPITRLGNVEGDAEIKETIGSNDYIPVIDGDDADEMKKVSANKLVPNTRTVNGKALSADITLSASDVSAIPTSQKGAASGVAPLDSNSRVPAKNLFNHYVCNTKASEPTKQIRVESKKNIWIGTEIYVQFTNGNSFTSRGCQLQILDATNTTPGAGFHDIYTKAGVQCLEALNTGDVVHFVFDGTYWRKMGDAAFVDVSGDLLASQAPVVFGECTSDGNYTTKSASIPNFVLRKGKEVTIKFTHGNSVANPTLSINNAVTKPIYKNGVAAKSGAWSNGETVHFVYDGTNWVIVGKTGSEPTATTSVAGVAQLSSSVTSTSETMAATPKAVKQAYDLAEKANVGQKTYIVTENTGGTGETSTRTGTTDDSFVLETGVRIAFFQNGGKATTGTVTLNINNTGACGIYDNTGNEISGTILSDYYPLYLTYNEGYWATDFTLANPNQSVCGMVRVSKQVSLNSVATVPTSSVTANLNSRITALENNSNIVTSTEDLVAGTSELADGTLYFVYE